MLTIKRHTKNNKVLWDNFVKNANNGTLFHLRRFLSYHPEGRFVDHSIEVYKKNTLFSVFPAAESDINGKNLLVSHPGSTVGSLVVPESVSISDSFELIEILINYAKRNKFDGIRLTIPPVFYQNRSSNYTDVGSIKKEVEDSKNLFKKHSWPTIDVTRKSVEETAASIIKIIEIKRKK